MRCINDGDEMTRMTWEADVEVDRCPTCGGTWLDHGELEQLQSTVERDYSEDLARPAIDDIRAAFARAHASVADNRLCPQCDVPMEQREHGYTSQVMVDTCPGCRGVWLDKGELKALEVFFERTADASNTPRHSLLAAVLGVFRR